MHYLANSHNNRASVSADLAILLSSSLYVAAFLRRVSTSHKKDSKRLKHKQINILEFQNQMIDKPVISIAQSLLDCSQVNGIRNDMVIILVFFNIDRVLELLSNW